MTHVSMEPLLTRVRALIDASKSEDGLLEALAAIDALGRVLEVLGESSTVAEMLGLEGRELSTLLARGRRLGRGAAANSDGANSDAASSDAAFAQRHALGLARRGLDRLSLLSSDPLSGSAADGKDGRPVPEATLLRLVRGQLDGFRAAEVAFDAARCAANRDELVLLLGEAKRFRAVERPLLRLAADGPSPMRDPSLGVVVGTFGREDGTLELEAVRFPDGIVALYASAPRALTLEGPKKTKVVVAGGAPGYLELRLPKGRPAHVRVEGIDLEL